MSIVVVELTNTFFVNSPNISTNIGLPACDILILSFSSVFHRNWLYLTLMLLACVVVVVVFNTIGVFSSSVDGSIIPLIRPQLPFCSYKKYLLSSEDELDPTEREFLDGHDYDDPGQTSVLRTPLR